MKENCCVALKWNFWIFGLVGRKIIFLFNYISLKHPKVQHLVEFSTFFLKKVKKNHPIWPNLGVFSTLFFSFIFGDGSVAEGNTTCFSFLALLWYWANASNQKSTLAKHIDQRYWRLSFLSIYLCRLPCRILPMAFPLGHSRVKDAFNVWSW